jgi:hypothetical protein
MTRLLVFAVAALIAVAGPACAQSAPGSSLAAAAGPVAPVNERFVYIAAGAVAGAVLMPVLMADGMVLMSVAMGGIIGDMVYGSPHGSMRP